MFGRMKSWLKSNREIETTDKTKIIDNKYNNDVGYDPILREKQEEYALGIVAIVMFVRVLHFPREEIS